jgi:hypothetical protein
MDVVIRPFWIALSVAYFALAWVHYRIQEGIWISSHVTGPATALADESPGNFDRWNIAIALNQIRDGNIRNKKLLKYASYGFLLAGFISLLQGVLNLDSEIAINIVFVVLVLVVLLVIFYLKGQWLVALLPRSVQARLFNIRRWIKGRAIKFRGKHSFWARLFGGKKEKQS